MIENPMVTGNNEPRIFGYCCICSKPIYEGETYIEDVCDNILCFKCGEHDEWGAVLVAEIE